MAFWWRTNIVYLAVLLDCVFPQCGVRESSLPWRLLSVFPGCWPPGLQVGRLSGREKTQGPSQSDISPPFRVLSSFFRVSVAFAGYG